MWPFKEPLFQNSFISSGVLSSDSLRIRLREAGCVKLGHLLKTSIPHLAERFSIRSHRLLSKLVAEVCVSLPEVFRGFVKDRTVLDQWEEQHEYILYIDVKVAGLHSLAELKVST
ncbi:ephrin type-B receptor 4b-like [Xyrichtys novacula]|nr:ephrin type-B receptor 4b-like [Xyrichtys novacula]